MEQIKNATVDKLELASIFPEAKLVLKKLCAEDRKRITTCNELKNKIKSDIMFKVRPENLDIIVDLLMIQHTPIKYHIIKRGKTFNQLLSAEDRLKKNQTILNFIENKNNLGHIVNNQLDVDRAKAFPIPNLIKINRSGFGKCLWHDEKTASLKYYPKTNTVHCFGCNHSDDSIGVVQKLMDYSFKQAVKWLTSRT
jgi:hypothetical protein